MAEVARKMGVSRQQVYNIESHRQGHPTLLTALRYANAIGYTLVFEPKKKRKKSD